MYFKARVKFGNITSSSWLERHLNKKECRLIKYKKNRLTDACVIGEPWFTGSRDLGEPKSSPKYKVNLNLVNRQVEVLDQGSQDHD